MYRKVLFPNNFALIFILNKYIVLHIMDYFAIGMSMIMKVAAIDGKKMTRQKLKVIKKKQ